MRYRYICEPFISHISTKPLFAQSCWTKCFDTGIHYFEKMMWLESTPHLGQAYELATVLVGINELERQATAEQLTVSSLAYMSTLANTGRFEDIESVYSTTYQYLRCASIDSDLRYLFEKFNEQVAIHKLHPRLNKHFCTMHIKNGKILHTSNAIH